MPAHPAEPDRRAHARTFGERRRHSWSLSAQSVPVVDASEPSPSPASPVGDVCLSDGRSARAARASRTKVFRLSGSEVPAQDSPNPGP